MDDRVTFNHRNTPRVDIERYILEKGCYSPEENKKIYMSWFSNGPRYLFRAVDKKYGLSRKRMCDVGCAFGTNLLYGNSDSYGIEMDQYRARFARSLGLQVHCLDLMADDVDGLPKVEAVWCSAVLEHIACPYPFLAKLYSLLERGGLVAIYVPTIPLFKFLEKLPKLGRYFSGYRSTEHVNAFVPQTLRFVCEQVGFHTVEVSPFYPAPISLFNHSPLLNQITARAVYIGEKKT